MKEFESREARWEEEAQALSSFYPALPSTEDLTKQAHSLQDTPSQIKSNSQAQNLQSTQASDDWQPRYTSAAIKVFNAELSSVPIPQEPEPESHVSTPLTSSPKSELDSKEIAKYDVENDTEVDLKPIIDEEALPLPHWFEDQSTRNSIVYKAGSIVLDEVESLALSMVYCPKGSFLMGSNRGEPAERPCHQVQISRPLLMSQSLVTQRLWALVMGFSPSRFIDPERPVERFLGVNQSSFATD